ncbi:MAG: benzoate/H(+) symporter BenE family transporter [Actinomycetes bacterium]
MAITLSDLKAPALAGAVATLAGTAASLGIVLAAFTSLGASKAETITAIAAMLAIYGLLSVLLSWFFKMPISIVWSTPGGALLVASGSLHYGFGAAVGAFLYTSVLLILTGLWPWLGRMARSIPKPIANAMLAGVIFNFCLAPIQAIVVYPAVVIPAVLAWIILLRFNRVWAAPAAMAIILTLGSISQGIKPDWANTLPQLQFVAPEFNIAAIISIGIPLYLVTMASQNIPGIAIMKSFGYEVPFGASMFATGIGSAVSSLFGGFSVNLAAITAAINADEHAHPDKNKRWLASVLGGLGYVAMAVFAGLIASIALEIPHILILTAAGLALIVTIGSALAAATEFESFRVAAIVTFLTTTSGIVIYGIGSAFWALLAGVAIWIFTRRKAETA